MVEVLSIVIAGLALALLGYSCLTRPSYMDGRGQGPEWLMSDPHPVPREILSQHFERELRLGASHDAPSIRRYPENWGSVGRAERRAGITPVGLGLGDTDGNVRR